MICGQEFQSLEMASMSWGGGGNDGHRDVACLKAPAAFSFRKEKRVQRAREGPVSVSCAAWVVAVTQSHGSEVTELGLLHLVTLLSCFQTTPCRKPRRSDFPLSAGQLFSLAEPGDFRGDQGGRGSAPPLQLAPERWGLAEVPPARGGGRKGHSGHSPSDLS